MRAEARKTRSSRSDPVPPGGRLETRTRVALSPVRDVVGTMKRRREDEIAIFASERACAVPAVGLQRMPVRP